MIKNIFAAIGIAVVVFLIAAIVGVYVIDYCYHGCGSN